MLVYIPRALELLKINKPYKSRTTIINILPTQTKNRPLNHSNGPVRFFWPGLIYSFSSTGWLSWAENQLHTKSYGFILLMEEILHQLIGSFSHYLFTGFYTSRAVLISSIVSLKCSTNQTTNHQRCGSWEFQNSYKLSK